ncbi:MAG: tetratricopeptide repeat protein [bacterium]
MRWQGVRGSGAWPWFIAAVLWGAAASLACVVADPPVVRRGEDISIAARMFGRCVSALAGEAYGRADLTFHKGRPTYHEKAFSNDVFQVWRRELAPVGHSHLGGSETKEIMSWLRFASLLDPHNVTYHLNAAYWLMSGDIGRPDAARKVLLEARDLNPDSYLVYLGLSQFATKTGDRSLARRSCDRALELWPRGKSPDDDEDQLKIDRREILSLRVILREMEGDMAGAIADLQAILGMFPESPLVRSRIMLIAAGQETAAMAEQRWEALRKQEYYHVCEGEAAAHEEHEHDQGDGDGM